MLSEERLIDIIKRIEGGKIATVAIAEGRNHLITNGCLTFKFPSKTLPLCETLNDLVTAGKNSKYSDRIKKFWAKIDSVGGLPAEFLVPGEVAIPEEVKNDYSGISAFALGKMVCYYQKAYIDVIEDIAECPDYYIDEKGDLKLLIAAIENKAIAACANIKYEEEDNVEDNGRTTESGEGIRQNKKRLRHELQRRDSKMVPTKCRTESRSGSNSSSVETGEEGRNRSSETPLYVPRATCWRSPRTGGSDPLAAKGTDEDNQCHGELD